MASLDKSINKSHGPVLITGGSGLLALGWACAMRDRQRIILGTHCHEVRLTGVESVTIDLETPDAFSKALNRFKPSLVIHTAGLTSVDECERDLILAKHVNADLAENVAVATFAEGISLVHISTDHLFSGQRPFCDETEKPHPLNIYAATKLDAERRVLSAHPEALVIRTNFFGWGNAFRRSFSDWIIDNLRHGREITLFDDVYFSPILIESLAYATHDLHGLGVSGVINVVGDERVSKLEFGRMLAEHLGLDDRLIRLGKIGAAKLHAQRPQDMSLDNTKARRTLRRPLGTLSQFFQRLAHQEVSGLARELFNSVASNSGVASVNS